MKTFIAFLRLSGTVILSVIMIPLILCTMTLFAVTHAVTPDYLTEIIKSATSQTDVTPIPSVSENNIFKSLSCDKNVISAVPLADVAENITYDSFGVDLKDIFGEIKIDEENGIIYIGETGKIDIGSTGLANVPEIKKIKPTEENIRNILINKNIIQTVQNYLEHSLGAYITGEKLPDISAEQFEVLTVAVLNGVESEFNIDIPDDVKNNVASEISKNNVELSDIVRDNIPNINDVKEEFCIQNGIDTVEFDKMLPVIATAVKMIFDNTLFLLMLGTVIFVAFLILLLNFKKLNGLLIVGIIGFICGLLFVASGFLGNAIANATEYAYLLNNIFNLFKSTGLVTMSVSVGLTVIKIVVGNIVSGKLKKDNKIAEI